MGAYSKSNVTEERLDAKYSLTRVVGRTGPSQAARASSFLSLQTAMFLNGTLLPRPTGNASIVCRYLHTCVAAVLLHLHGKAEAPAVVARVYMCEHHIKLLSFPCKFIDQNDTKLAAGTPRSTLGYSLCKFIDQAGGKMIEA